MVKGQLKTRRDLIVCEDLVEQLLGQQIKQLQTQ